MINGNINRLANNNNRRKSLGIDNSNKPEAVACRQFF